MTPTTKKVVRVQLDLTESRIKELEEIMVKTGVSTRKDVFENALVLLDWAVSQADRGRTFGAWDENTETFHEVLMPALASVRKNYEAENKDSPAEVEL